MIDFRNNTNTTKVHENDVINEQICIEEMETKQQLLQIEPTPLSPCEIVTDLNIVNKAELILNFIRTNAITEDNTKLVGKKLDEILAILNENVHLKSVDITNIPKIMEPQVSLYSTKINQVETNELENLMDLDVIELELENENCEYIHSGFDHCF